MRIVVTGGAGFIGSHLCERLVGEGHTVVCVDNFFTGHRANVAHLGRTGRFALVEHDMVEPLRIDGPVDRIYHLACPASPVHYQKDPIYTFRINALGSMHALELAREKGARILLSSTSEVYGDPLEHPQQESYRGNVNPDGPRACYDEGKRGAETLFFDYRRMHGTDIRVARIFNTYGPLMDPKDGRVVSNFIIQALAGEDITVYGDGSQTRSFCYVSDLVEGLVRLMEGTVIGPVNLGNPGEFTVLALAQKVIAMTGSASQIAFRPLPIDDPTKRRPDITLAKMRLGWEPKVPLDEGLQKTIGWFADHENP